MTAAPIIPTSRPGGQSSVATRKQATLVILSNPGTNPEPSDFEAMKSNMLCRIANTMKPRSDA
jgi:hypothetical protein